MKRRLIICYAALLMVTVLSCGKKVMVPPRIDLKGYEIIGIIEFTCAHEGELGSFTTRKFMEAIRKDQGMVRIIDLATEKEVLDAIDYNRMDAAAYKAIGEKYNVSTIFTGELVVSDVRPDITITPGLGYMGFGAEVDATLSTQMVETATGASVWSNSADATESVGHVSIFGRKAFAFDAEDPDKAYGKLVDALVYETTRDFRVTWERR
ncbi:hypothetical protein AYK25_07510 [Thermoplasmatales archaeon SM1-50]|nr:MAG: hypothetical protein AYK25_07510 [Thermoplasmatales archaeon SM1-50]